MAIVITVPGATHSTMTLPPTGLHKSPEDTDALYTVPPQFVNSPMFRSVAAIPDVAVFGVPHEEMGEEVKAVVQPANWADIGPELEKELIEYCRSKISAIKCPRSIDFERELPREETGKLKKRLIKDRYWQAGKAIN